MKMEVPGTAIRTRPRAQSRAERSLACTNTIKRRGNTEIYRWVSIAKVPGSRDVRKSYNTTETRRAFGVGSQQEPPLVAAD